MVVYANSRPENACIYFRIRIERCVQDNADITTLFV